MILCPPFAKDDRDREDWFSRVMILVPESQIATARTKLRTSTPLEMILGVNTYAVKRSRNAAPHERNTYSGIMPAHNIPVMTLQFMAFHQLYQGSSASLNINE